MSEEAFARSIWNYYRAHGRHELPWRQPEADGSFDSYKILVSEVMLQQTQVSRVIPKYQEFLLVFPTVQQLAAAKLGDVLRTWSGMGYNRRAKFLWQAAQMVRQDYGGEIPRKLEELIKLPGVGKNTAGAVLTYAFNQPNVFIETNIRAVYIHHFFKDRQGVADQELKPIIEQTWDQNKPREFGWALMDYGSHLKATTGNAAARSKHHTKQSRFEGSLRQIRGQVIQLLAANPLSLQELQQAIVDNRLVKVLADLETEGLVQQNRSNYDLT